MKTIKYIGVVVAGLIVVVIVLGLLPSKSLELERIYRDQHARINAGQQIARRARVAHIAEDAFYTDDLGKLRAMGLATDEESAVLSNSKIEFWGNPKKGTQRLIIHGTNGESSVYP